MNESGGTIPILKSPGHTVAEIDFADIVFTRFLKRAFGRVHDSIIKSRCKSLATSISRFGCFFMYGHKIFDLGYVSNVMC